jgi:hypothetical protein
MLVAQVRYGRGQAAAWQQYDLNTEAGVKQFLADQGHPDFDQLVEALRPKDAVLPFETHLFTDSMSINLPPGGGSYAAIMQGGEEVARVTGESGRFVLTQYQDRFNYSVRTLKRCANGEEADYGDLLSSFSAGVASIEGFVNYKAEPHRHRLPRGNDRKVGLDFKLDNWIPSLSANKRINKGEKYWRDFKEIRKIRNERESHSKAVLYDVSDSKFCKQLNQWRTGIAVMLLALHAMTGYFAPPELVKHAFLPEIEPVTE